MCGYCGGFPVVCGRWVWPGGIAGFWTRFFMFIWFCSAEGFCCNPSLLEDMFAMCCCRYALLSINYVKADLYAAASCAKFSTASLRLFSSTTFPAKPCWLAVLDCISILIIYSMLKRKRNPLKVFWISRRLNHYLYANRYFPVESIKVSDVFISCSAVNAVPPAIAKL